MCSETGFNAEQIELSVGFLFTTLHVENDLSQVSAFLESGQCKGCLFQFEASLDHRLQLLHGVKFKHRPLRFCHLLGNAVTVVGPLQARDRDVLDEG